jgi:hypothetical protein
VGEAGAILMIAGQRRQQSGMTVDYMDVMRQAIENERWKVLREVVDILAEVRTEKCIEYRTHDATFYKDEVLERLRELEPQ